MLAVGIVSVFLDGQQRLNHRIIQKIAANNKAAQTFIFHKAPPHHDN